MPDSYAERLARLAGILRYAIPASETPEGQKHEQAYYEALGRFVQIYAEVERMVAQTLWKYAGTVPAVSKIVFSGTKTDQGSTWIKQAAQATGASQKAREDLENVFRQLGDINKVRNAILHYGAENVAEGRATVSDAWKAKAEPTEYAISPRSLSDMRDDCRKIIAHLGYRHLGRPWPKSAGGNEMLDNVLQRPWRYKHPQPPKARTTESKALHATRQRLIRLLRQRASRA